MTALPDTWVLIIGVLTGLVVGLLIAVPVYAAWQAEVEQLRRELAEEKQARAAVETSRNHLLRRLREVPAPTAFPQTVAAVRRGPWGGAS